MQDANKASGFDEISIEDAHRRNDLELFRMFKKSKVILNSIHNLLYFLKSNESVFTVGTTDKDFVFL